MLTSTLLKVSRLAALCAMFVLLALLMCMQTYAQIPLTVRNPSFELPDSGKVKGFDGKCSNASWTNLQDVPDWFVDSDDSLQYDSGVEQDSPTDGKYTAFLMGNDPGIYQNLSTVIKADDIIKLTVDARVSWLGETLTMEIFYQQDSTRYLIVTEDKTLTGSMAEYSISFKAADYPNAVGNKLGIRFKNAKGGESWLQIDNVRLTLENPGLIPLVNNSFEQPDSGKIKGWDGVCADANWTGQLQDIAGWQSDDFAFDSGVETGYTATDGIYTAFMMGQDEGVYNVSDYDIKEGDEFSLSVDARITWAATSLEMIIFYLNDKNERAEIAYTVEELTNDMAEYVLTGKAPAEAIGKKVGVWFKNASETAQSWLGFDNVRLTNLNTTDVKKLDSKPANFSLEQNYPNPFNPTTQIHYSVEKTGNVHLSVYDLLGKEVAVLVNGDQSMGSYVVPFNASNLSNGVYFYTLQSSGKVSTKKMLLLK